MTDFSHLEQLNADNASDYEITEIEVGGVSPTLQLKVSGESNKGYFNDLLRVTGQAKGQRQRKLKIDAKLMSKMRSDDRELFPVHIIVGWKNMKDAKGKDVKFSVASCKDFITALPNWVFDGIRNFAADPENFVTVIDVEEKAGN